MREKQNNRMIDEYILQKEPNHDIEFIESTNEETELTTGKSSHLNWILLILIVILLFRFI